MIYLILTYIFSSLLYLLVAIRRKSSVSRVLVIQTAKIGDLICSTPVFREVKKKYPDAQLTVIVNPITKELLKYNPHIDKIITIKNTDYRGFSGKLKLSKLIRKGNYDIAICLNPNVPFAIALFWGLVPIRLSVMPNFVGITFRLASLFFSYLERHISGQLITETYMKMLKAIGIESDDISKEVYKSKEADAKAQQILGLSDKPLIGIAVSSGNKLKELGTEKIIRLIDMLLDNMDIYVVLIGSTQDRNAANIILDAASKRDRIVNAAGRLSLKELPALIERLSLFIGVDTGITYMADALSVPIIHLAGPIDVSEQRPTGKNVKIIQQKISCSPCTYVFKTAHTCKTWTKECIEKINIEEIVDTARKIVSHVCR
ncbi:MAG: glycosyltransferase family 9 protein [Nitrospiraceae bacterium]|nr:glycosyltransferase family 9 protein [Nitrospiraceae bacterium]